MKEIILKKRTPEELQEKILMLITENQLLKDRINKATDYIEKCNPVVDLHSMFLNESYISNYGACDLLEILEGVNDDV